jgi:hypothetical protein
MSRRLVSVTMLSLGLTALHASAARGDHSVLEGETGLAGGSVLLALIVSLLTGLVCFGLMVWDPKKSKSGRGPNAHE